MKFIKLSDIKISEDFLETKPRDEKIQNAVKHIEEYGKIDKPIVLRDGVLVDSYARYIAASIKGLQEVPYVELQRMHYVVGKFLDKGKEYVWKNDKGINIKAGDKVYAKNMYGGARYVVVTRVFKSDSLYLYKKHKSVIKKINY